MNLRTHNRNREAGGILIVTFFIVTSIFIGLGSYLLLVRAQYVSIARSQAWNETMTACEAGVEDAMAQLNPGALTTNIVVVRSANGWGSPSSGFYGPMNRTVQSNTTYSVVFSDVPQPVIYSTGYVTMPDLSAKLTRVVRVGTTNIPLFNVALAARTNVTMNGNALGTDSFNSSNSNLSSNGVYSSSRASTNGDVAVEYGTLDLGNHTITGDVYLGPTASLGNSSQASQVSGSVYTDFNSDFPAPVAPDTTGWLSSAPGGGVIGGLLGLLGGTTFGHIFSTSGNYVISSFSGTVYIAPGVHVNLLVQGGSLDGLTIDGSGATAGSLTLYVSAASFSLGGSTTLNYQGKAANFSYIGLASNKSISLSGNAEFTGTIYAPYASVSFSGGGSSDYDFVGSLICNTISFNGHYMFHFDEDLLNSGPSRGYLAVSWTEI